MAALPFFQSRTLREARLLAKHARRLIHRRRDLLPPAAVAAVEADIAALEVATGAGDERAVAEISGRLDPQLGKMFPARGDSAWRENCEVFLVSLILVVAVRAYFFQPFKIPTGSMQPTLNGIVAHPLPASRENPGFARRVLESVSLGRTYVDVRAAAADEQIVSMQEFEKPSSVLGRFYTQTTTRLAGSSGRTYEVSAPMSALVGPDGFNVARGRTYQAGEPLAHGYISSGDQVFVDKLTYHFRRPRRADVFVFRTVGIPGIRMEDPNVQSQFYIKRLAGIPNDVLRVAAPDLFVNGERAREPMLERVMSKRDGYRGYANLHGLSSPQATLTAPPDGYLALGDNSYQSFDSRGWGPVPERNVVGRGLFVYWPFTKHWGAIR